MYFLRIIKIHKQMTININQRKNYYNNLGLIKKIVKVNKTNPLKTTSLHKKNLEININLKLASYNHSHYKTNI